MRNPQEEKPFNRFVAEVEDVEVIGRVLETQNTTRKPARAIQEKTDGCPQDRV